MEEVRRVIRDGQFYLVQENTKIIGVNILTKVRGHLTFIDGEAMFTKTEGVVFISTAFPHSETFFEVIRDFRIVGRNFIPVKPGSLLDSKGKKPPDSYTPDRMNIDYIRFPTEKELEYYLQTETI